MISIKIVNAPKSKIWYKKYVGKSAIVNKPQKFYGGMPPVVRVVSIEGNTTHRNKYIREMDIKIMR